MQVKDCHKKGKLLEDEMYLNWNNWKWDLMSLDYSDKP